MKPAFLLFFDNFSSTYFLLFCFYSTIYINSYNVVIKDIYDFIPTGVTTFRWTQKLSLHAVSLENEKE